MKGEEGGAHPASATPRRMLQLSTSASPPRSTPSGRVRGSHAWIVAPARRTDHRLGFPASERNGTPVVDHPAATSWSARRMLQSATSSWPASSIAFRSAGRSSSDIICVTRVRRSRRPREHR